ncbi:MAG: DUF883 domain-containing protein [Ottowia sp.]|nr:DUF883 domain-containing protein [Ottowia sp.]
MSDLKAVLANAEEFLKQAAIHSGERANELREKGLHALRQAKEKAQDLQETVTASSKQAIHATDDYVHTHPWRSIGIATGLGLLIGLMINRK